jgi:hypothetical protein
MVPRRELTTLGGGYPTWSRDGSGVYFIAIGDPSRQVYRVSIADGTIEKIVALSSVERGSFFMSDWMGLTPEDAPLALLNLRAEDIYSCNLTYR